MVKGKFIDVGEAKIYYEILKKKKMIVYLHGHTWNLTVFNFYRKHFEKLGYGFLCIDLRGEGKSSKLFDEKYYELDSYVEDLNKIMLKEKISKAHFMGCSMGCSISMSFAIKHPKKVQSLTLISGSPHIKETLSLILKLAILTEPFSRFIFGKIVEKKVKKYVNFSSLRGKTLIDIASESISNADKNQKKAWNVMKNKIRNWNLKKDLKKIKFPSLIIHGEKDYLVLPKAAFMLYKGITKSETPVIVPDKGHDIIIQEPELISEFMEDFLRRKVK